MKKWETPKVEKLDVVLTQVAAPDDSWNKNFSQFPGGKNHNKIFSGNANK